MTLWVLKTHRFRTNPRYGKGLYRMRLQLERDFYLFRKGGWRFIVLDDVLPEPDGSYRSGGEVPLRIHPGGIKTRVAWHEVPGKKKKDASSPVGTVDQGFLQMCHSPFLGLGWNKATDKNNVL
jgi:hypothetical protein